jgi:EAL domain-containing protein (putative c-di-GMP-specific phosphodiesterase class I)/GGDEF domain-containing protein
MSVESSDHEIRKLRSQNVLLKRDSDRMQSYDRLTGLRNYAAFIDHSDRLLRLRGSNKSQSAMIEISISGIPRLGDGLGRFASEYIVSAVANRINQCVAFEFVAGRIDHASFAVLILDTAGPMEALAAAKTLVEAMTLPIDWIDRKIVIEARAGVAISDAEMQSARALLQNAGFAARQTAHKTGPSYNFFNPLLAKADNRRESLIAAIKGAVEHQHLRLQYQPIFDAKTAGLTGFEALMRMHHPDLGMVSPAEFIPLAEECKLISNLGRWALEEACRVALTWPQHLIVAVNVSPQQFYDGTLLKDVQQVLEKLDFPSYRLEVEITESSLLHDSELVFAQLNTLREMGCSIALDDFGTGYSSLNYLWKFPFSKLKIDRSFVQTLGSSKKAEVMLRSIMDLGRNLGMKITAEGVETIEQAQIIRSLGCNYLQGYLCGRPASEADLSALINRNNSEHLLQSV